MTGHWRYVLPMIDQFRRRVQQASANIAKLQKDKSGLETKRADVHRKMNAAKKAASTTRSDSTRNMKQREIERLHRELASDESKIAAIDGKIAAEQRKLNDAQKSLSNEEVKAGKGQEWQAELLNRRTRRTIAELGSQLREQVHHYQGALAPPRQPCGRRKDGLLMKRPTLSNDSASYDTLSLSRLPGEPPGLLRRTGPRFPDCPARRRRPGLLRNRLEEPVIRGRLGFEPPSPCRCSTSPVPSSMA